MMRTLLFILLLLTVSVLQSQNEDLYSIVNTGDFDEGFTLVADESGGYLIAGSTGTTQPGGSTVYVVKLDDSGDYQWSLSFVTDGASRINDGIQTASGDFILAGYSHTASGIPSGLVMRVSAAGEHLWTEYYGSPTLPDFINSVSPASSFSSGYVLVGEQGRSSGYSDAWIFRIGENGNVVENYLDGGAQNDGFTSIDVQTGFYAVGGFTKSLSPDSIKTACYLKYYNFEFDEVGTYIFNQGSKCKIKDTRFIGDQAEVGIAAEWQRNDSVFPLAAKYDRSQGRQWELVADSVQNSWGELRRDGAFGAIWAGEIFNETGRREIAYQSVETFNGIVDTLALFSSEHDYRVGGLYVDDSTVTMAGTRFENGQGMGDLFLVRIRKNAAFNPADSLYLIDDNISIVTTVEKAKFAVQTDDYKLYPNPATEYITLEGLSSSHAELRILDVTGSVLKVERLSGASSSYQVNINRLPQGMYHLQIIESGQDRQRVTVKSFVKQR